MSSRSDGPQHYTILGRGNRNMVVEGNGEKFPFERERPDLRESRTSSTINLPTFSTKEEDIMRVFLFVALLAFLGQAGEAQTNDSSKSFPDSASVVKYFRGIDVIEGYKKGMPLFESDRFSVHTSHRDSAGQAELHAKDTDIFYVQQGSATFVTGGTIIDGKHTHPGEVRGTGIVNGVEHHLATGDVIIIPRGTPHWFKEVGSPFDYFVVKITE
jgi:quercetin dioxygenase-like cupin family protein